jgi:hypothetical protein
MKRLATALLMLCSCVAGGCGFGGDDDVTERVQQPSLLTRADIERYPAGSPQRAFFEWWRTVQYDNAVAAVRFYSDDLALTARKLDRMLAYGADGLGLRKQPKLVEVDVNGRRATVFLLLQSRVLNPNGRVDTVRTARSFNLVREGGQWKLADNLYVERGAAVSKKLFEAAERQRRRQQ